MHASIVARMEVNPILVSVPQAGQMLGRGVSTIYDLIGAGKIRAVKSDGRTLVVVASLHEYAAGLPEAKVAPPRRRKPQHLREAATA
jgi:excisionase family DNA binding protein